MSGGGASDGGNDPSERVSAAEPDRKTPTAGAEDRPHISEVERQESPYTESQVIMTTVKLVSPFAFTYGLFVTFHGGASPGGGFQGGAIMAAVVFMIAFAFGIDSTRQWLANTVVVGLAVGGVLAFAGIGLASMALGGAFLQYELLPFIPKPETYGMEAVEILGIATIVSGVLMGLFFLLAVGFDAGGATVIPDGGRTESDGGRTESDGGRTESDGGRTKQHVDPTSDDGGEK